MALIADQRTALAAAIDAIAGLNVYDTPRDRVGTPCAMLTAPLDAIEAITFGPGGYRWVWVVQLLVTRVDLDSAVDNLDPYISSTGASSVIAAINGIGGNYHVTEVRDIGNFEMNDANYLGANIVVEVLTND